MDRRTDLPNRSNDVQACSAHGWGFSRSTFCHLLGLWGLGRQLTFPRQIALDYLWSTLRVVDDPLKDTFVRPVSTMPCGSSMQRFDKLESQDDLGGAPARLPCCTRLCAWGRVFQQLALTARALAVLVGSAERLPLFVGVAGGNYTLFGSLRWSILVLGQSPRKSWDAGRH